jgi:hypothetical protein
MVKYKPNKEWTDACAIHARTDPVRFADERALNRYIVVAVEDYQNSKARRNASSKPCDDLEKALKIIKSPILEGSLEIVREPPSAYVKGKIKDEGEKCLGTLLDLF